MLDIKLRSASLVCVLGAAAIAAGCAGEDDPGSEPITSASASVSGVSSGTTAASATTSAPIGSSTPSTTPSTSSTAPSNGGCATTGYSAVTEGFTFPGAVQVFGNTDTAGSTACIEATAAATCLKGKVTLAGEMYENWGTQIGFQMVQTDAQGVAAAPFDAAALGIVGFRFTLTGAGSSAKGKPPKVRLQVAMTNLDGIEYQSYAYAKDGSYTGDYTADQTAVVVDFTDITAPEWAHEALDPNPPTEVIPDALDTTRLHSVQFQVTTDQTNEHDYNVCVSAFDWLDADGNVVPVEAPVVPTDDGGTPVGDSGTDGGPTDDGGVPPVGDGGPMDDSSVPPVGDAGVDSSVPADAGADAN
jgi:hypothetical protein